MKRRIWIAALSVSFLGACNWVSGECWLRSEDGAGSGQGGGPIVPAGGGFGDDPSPTPQDANPPPPPECLQVPQGACYQNCLKSYEDAAAECGKIADDSQRLACQTTAYKVYFACRDNCQTQQNDCKETCKKQCDKIHDRCHENCTKNDPTQKCHKECNDDYSACLLECEKNC